MNNKTRVGLIGVGLMGHGLGKNILKNGYSLSVLAHRNRKPVESLLGQGATEAVSARELAENCDVVILCVTGSPEVEDTLYREGGLLEGMHEGLIIADCSTAEPDSTLKVSADIESAGGRYVDTPLTRTPKEAEMGQLGVMTGGDEATLAEIRPILDCFAETVIHAGDVGSAHKLKLINNFLSLGKAALVSEAVAAAAKGGVDMQALHDIVVAGGANSVMFERLMGVALRDDDSALQFYIQNAQKDLRYYTTMTQNQSSTSFIAESVHQTYMLANNLGHGDKYVPRMVDVMAEINNTKINK
ncbi:MAG: NAD(P)-dependent oxidoreductase [Gammaproteobacteria bacterium]|nr:NAD(P)-dependent oxidoreductase [Gammaproteobacteria bacterium]